MITFQKLNRKVRQEHAKDAKNHCALCDKLCVLCGKIIQHYKKTPNTEVCLCPDLPDWSLDKRRCKKVDLFPTPTNKPKHLSEDKVEHTCSYVYFYSGNYGQ